MVRYLILAMGLLLLSEGCAERHKPLTPDGRRLSNGQIVELAKPLTALRPHEVSFALGATSYAQLVTMEQGFRRANRGLELVTLYDEVLKKNPDHLHAATRQVLLLFELKMRRRARKSLMAYWRRHPKDLNLRYLIAVMMARQARTSANKQHLLKFWKKLLQEKPDYRSPTGETAESIRKRIRKLEKELSSK